MPFDWFGFATLSLAIGALQLMLDRGEQLNWFGSTEIIAEAIVAGTAFYLFLVHTFTADPAVREPAPVHSTAISRPVWSSSSWSASSCWRRWRC